MNERDVGEALVEFAAGLLLPKPHFLSVLHALEILYFFKISVLI